LDLWDLGFGIWDLNAEGVQALTAARIRTFQPSSKRTNSSAGTGLLK
jgi:hypothetical protein